MKRNLNYLVNPVTGIVIMALFFFSCSDDDQTAEPPLFQNVVGEVLGPTSCGGQNGQAFEISVSVLDESDFIITGTLPERFKEQGLEIMFDMNPSTEGIEECTANFTGQVFYKVINVKLSQ